MTIPISTLRSRSDTDPWMAAGFSIRDNDQKHRFEIDLGDGSLAIADYVLSDGRITFTHTEVPTAHRGKGIGTALIRSALASVREHGLRLNPLCPFFAAFIMQHPEEQDLLDPAARKLLKLG